VAFFAFFACVIYWLVYVVDFVHEIPIFILKSTLHILIVKTQKQVTPRSHPEQDNSLILACEEKKEEKKKLLLMGCSNYFLMHLEGLCLSSWISLITSQFYGSQA